MTHDTITRGLKVAAKIGVYGLIMSVPLLFILWVER